jgi:hypothetical protein
MYITKVNLCTQQHCYSFPFKNFSVAGFETGFSASQTEAMTTAPRHDAKMFCKSASRELKGALAPKV